MGFEKILFYLFSAVLVFAAIMVVTRRNPVQAALFLVLVFFSSAVIWMLAEAEFLAITLVLVDAYRTDLLHEKERGVGPALFFFGYRIAMLVSGALALILSDRIGWQNTYLIMAGCMMMGLTSSLSGPEPEKEIVPPNTLSEAVLGPLKDYSRVHPPLWCCSLSFCINWGTPMPEL